MKRLMSRQYFAALCVFITAPVLLAENWTTLEDDGLHDPLNPALNLLQDPSEALSVLAPDSAGNKVDWVTAVRDGQIRPWTSLDNKQVAERHDTDIVMRKTLSLPPVLFPHKAHNEWMSCDMCHDDIFLPAEHGNEISMSRILEGEQCGVCHGAVAFPLTECNRCHSVVSKDPVAVPVSGVLVNKK